MNSDAFDQPERRRSKRWHCDSQIVWRIQGGRRQRQGRVPERSLDGMIITADKKDAVPAGTYVFPGDLETGVRHGFRKGVICRTADAGERESLLFVAILA
jgi:hypothetical protein